MRRLQKLAKRGLYDPLTEHANCGVGFVASLNGVKSHDIVAQGPADPRQPRAPRRVRLRCEDRRRRGHPDPDPARVPPARRPAARDPAAGRAASTARAWCSCRRTSRQRARCEELFEAVVRQEGQDVLGWRDVPRNSDVPRRRRPRRRAGHPAGVHRPRARASRMTPPSSASST